MPPCRGRPGRIGVRQGDRQRNPGPEVLGRALHRLAGGRARLSKAPGLRQGGGGSHEPVASATARTDVSQRRLERRAAVTGAQQDRPAGVFACAVVGPPRENKRRERQGERCERDAQRDAGGAGHAGEA